MEETVLKEKVFNLLVTFVNRMSEINLYNWSDEFKKEEFKNAFNEYTKSIKNLINWNELSDKECDALHMMKYDNKSNLMLIPMYLYYGLNKGAELTAIDNEKVIFDGSNIDLDNRFGYLAYGVCPKKI